MTGWAWFGIYYVVAAVGFGVSQVAWARGRRAKGVAVTSPIGQLVFTVLCAPLALAIAAAFAWEVLMAVLRLLARL